MFFEMIWFLRRLQMDMVILFVFWTYSMKIILSLMSINILTYIYTYTQNDTHTQMYAHTHTNKRFIPIKFSLYLQLLIGHTWLFMFVWTGKHSKMHVAIATIAVIHIISSSILIPTEATYFHRYFFGKGAPGRSR